MKRYKYPAIIAAALGLTLSSCSDDVVESILTLPEGTSSELTLDCASAVQSLPVQANGAWTATVVYDDATDAKYPDVWIGLLTPKGKGNGTINFVVDANNSEAYRNAKIVLASGNKSLEYKIGQQPVSFGDDNADIDMSMFNKSEVPLGFGIKMRNTTGTRDISNVLLGQVLNLNSLVANDDEVKKLVEEFKLKPQSYVSVNTNVETDINLVKKKSIEASSRKIGANLKVTVAYGMFKLNLNGNFKMFGESNNSIVNFSAMSAPIKGIYSISQVDINSAFAKLKDADGDNEATKENKAAARTLLFSQNFIVLRDTIEKLVANGAALDTLEMNTECELYEAIKTLDQKFGPAYITNAEVGGSAELNYLYSYQTASDTLGIDGKLSVGFNSLLNFNADAEASYDNNIKSYLEESQFQCKIKGGDAKAAEELSNDLADLMDSEATIKASTVQKSIRKWSNSLNLDNSTCVSYTPEPIWTLFSTKAAKELKKYFWYRYPNNGDKCPYPYDVRNIIQNEGI